MKSRPQPETNALLPEDISPLAPQTAEDWLEAAHSMQNGLLSASYRGLSAIDCCTLAIKKNEGDDITRQAHLMRQSLRSNNPNMQEATEATLKLYLMSHEERTTLINRRQRFALSNLGEKQEKLEHRPGPLQRLKSTRGNTPNNALSPEQTERDAEISRKLEANIAAENAARALQSEQAEAAQNPQAPLRRNSFNSNNNFDWNNDAPESARRLQAQTSINAGQLVPQELMRNNRDIAPAAAVAEEREGRISPPNGFKPLPVPPVKKNAVAEIAAQSPVKNPWQAAHAPQKSSSLLGNQRKKDGAAAVPSQHGRVSPERDRDNNNNVPAQPAPENFNAFIKQKYTKEIRKHWKCASSLEIMKDPVIPASGNTYERAVIEAHWRRLDTCWKEKNQNIPENDREKLVYTDLNNTELKTNLLIPSNAIKAQILEAKEAYKTAYPAQYAKEFGQQEGQVLNNNNNNAAATGHLAQQQQRRESSESMERSK